MLWGLLFVAVAAGSLSRTSLFQEYVCGAALIGGIIAAVQGDFGTALFGAGVVAACVWRWSHA